MKKSNFYSNLKSQEKLDAILNILKTLSDKIDKKYKAQWRKDKEIRRIQEIQEEKLDEIILSIQTLNVSKGGKFDNPLIKSIEEISLNIILQTKV